MIDVTYIPAPAKHCLTHRHVVVLGQFDGFHVGHQALLSLAKEVAQHIDGQSSVVLFDPLPKIFLGKMSREDRLMTLEEQTAFVHGFGCDGVFRMCFDAHVANMAAATFVDEVLLQHCHAQAVVVGEDFRFGRGRSGTLSYLQSALEAQGRSLHVVPLAHDVARKIGSSACREALKKCDFQQLARWLGRPWSVALHGVITVRQGSSYVALPQRLMPTLARQSAALVFEDQRRQTVAVSTTPLSGGIGIQVHDVIIEGKADLIFDVW